MNPDNRGLALQSPVAEALRSAPQQASSIELRNIRIESPKAGSLSEIVDGSGEGGIRPFPPAVRTVGWKLPANGYARASRDADPAVQFADRILTCVDCGAEFVFSAGEQVFFQEREFKNNPKHCKLCKAKRSQRRPRQRVETLVTCAECGSVTTVPFMPRNGKPVLCRLCFTKAKPLPTDPQPALGTFNP